MSMYMYRGFEIFPLIYPHAQVGESRTRNYETGFDAAVKICLPGTDTTVTRSQTFKLLEGSPYASAGDARRASLRYAEVVIDEERGEQWMTSAAIRPVLHASPST
ncbi:conserved protein of unknown function [Burkholderia multivorans]